MLAMRVLTNTIVSQYLCKTRLRGQAVGATPWL